MIHTFRNFHDTLTVEHEQLQLIRDKYFQVLYSLKSFNPHSSQVSIYHIKVLVDSYNVHVIRVRQQQQKVPFDVDV